MKEWEQFLDYLKSKLPAESSGWISSYQIDRFDAQNLYLSFKDVFSLNFFKEHIGPELKFFKNSNNHPIKVHALLASAIEAGKKNPQVREIQFHFPAVGNFSFEHFVVTEDNRLVVDLLLSLQENTESFNPFFIYGSKSSGKTHLLKACYNFYQKKGLNCLYVDAETFSEHVVFAMKQSAMTEFRKLYRNIDMLFFDNIQVLGGKSATQEEFFHTFNSLHMSSKTIVISSDTPASLLKQIEPRLVSRFEWGLGVELPPVDKAHYQSLIEAISSQLEIKTTKDQRKTILEHFSQDTSAISNALHAILLRSHLDENTTEHHVDHTLEELKTQKKELTPDQITQSCAKFFTIKAKEIKGPSQVRPLAYPRQITMYLIRKHLNMPYKKMGEFFGRDHSTVMASITIIDEKLKNLDEDTLNAIKRIEWDLKQN